MQCSWPSLCPSIWHSRYSLSLKIISSEVTTFTTVTDSVMVCVQDQAVPQLEEVHSQSCGGAGLQLIHHILSCRSLHANKVYSILFSCFLKFLQLTLFCFVAHLFTLKSLSFHPRECNSTIKIGFFIWVLVYFVTVITIEFEDYLLHIS